VHLCEYASRKPVYYFYAYGLLVAGCLQAILGFGQFLRVDAFLETYHPAPQAPTVLSVQIINYISVFFCVFSGLSLGLMALVDLRSHIIIHNISTGLYAFFGLTYIILFLWVSDQVMHVSPTLVAWRIAGVCIGWGGCLLMFFSQIASWMCKVCCQKTDRRVQPTPPPPITPTREEECGLLSLPPAPPVLPGDDEVGKSSEDRAMEPRRGILSPFIYTLWAISQYIAFLGSAIFFGTFIPDFANMRITLISPN